MKRLGIFIHVPLSFYSKTAIAQTELQSATRDVFH